MKIVKEWYSAKELEGISGVPAQATNITRKAKNENWKMREAKGIKGGAFEYHFSSLPLETQKALSLDFAKLEENPTACEDEETIRLEQFNVVASCGSGKINDIVEVVSAIEYHQSHFRHLFGGLNPNDIKIITSNGDSMSPTIESRELLFVNIKVNSFEGDGIYVFTYGETLHIKRLQMAGDVLRVISDNTNYPMWEIKEENFDRLHIHARVLVGQSQQLKLFG